MASSNLAKTLINNLILRGITPIKTIGDSTFWITESIYIQVHKKTVSVVRDRHNDLSMYTTQLNIDDVISTLKKAINDGRPN